MTTDPLPYCSKRPIVSHATFSLTTGSLPSKKSMSFHPTFAVASDPLFSPLIRALVPCAMFLPSTGPPFSPSQRHGQLLVCSSCSCPAESPGRYMCCHSHHGLLSCDIMSNMFHMFGVHNHRFVLAKLWTGSFTAYFT